MAYTALYRKWRPQTFDDVSGQDHIVRTLRNQILTDHVGHAYLFCGTRGTGKTSVAKIFARAVNCEHPKNGSPCGECPSCKKIAAGNSLNVMEIDAASNNGVDDVREIRNQVQYPPAEGRYRVYIIDEVHMLSAGAFNALLKTLEEPPSYVIFILATTEVNRIPVTILSRCQRYDFHRISVQTITDRLTELCAAEKIDAEEAALRYIARVADGSMRDALSLLDQCAAFHFDEKLTYDNVLDELGAVDNSVFTRLLDELAAGDVRACLRELDQAIVQGRELTQMITDFIWYLRSVLLMKAGGPEMADMIGISTENAAIVKKQADALSENVLMRYIRVLSDLLGTMRLSSQKRVLAEIALIRLTRPEMETNQDAILERLEKVEKQMRDMPQNISALAGELAARGTSAAGALTNAPAGMPGSAGAAEKPKKVMLPRAEYEDLMEVRNNWRTIQGTVRQPGRAALAGTRVDPAGNGRLNIVFHDKTHYDIVSRSRGSREGDVLRELSASVAELYRKNMEFTAEYQSDGSDQEIEYGISDEELREKIHMDVEVEDTPDDRKN
jgi:DNA polymerase-3 subunit gamma/tau